MLKADMIGLDGQLWKAVRVIRMDAVPALPEKTLAEDVLIRCQDSGASLELCLCTDEKANVLTPFLLLRAQSGNPDELNSRLTALADMTLRILQAHGVQARQLPANDEARRPIERLTERQDDMLSGCGFFPQERLLQPEGVYVPGRMTQPLELGRLAQVLSGHRNALLSVQFNFAALSKSETEIARRESEKLSKMTHPQARDAQAVFAPWVSAGPAFMAGVFCFGSPSCLRDMTAQAKLYGLNSYPLPVKEWLNAGFWISGDMMGVRCAMRLGHERYVLLRPDLRGMLRFTHLYTLESALKTFVLPARPADVPGLKIGGIPQNSAPLPDALQEETGVYLGKTAGKSQKVYLPLKALSRHGAIVGKPGSGKTTFALGLMERLHRKEIPFLIIEPAKTEYRSLLKCIPGMRIYTPGRTDVSPLQLNVFLPPHGVTMEEYVSNLDAIFQMAVSMRHPLDVIFPQVIRRCYMRYGWRPDSTRDTPGAQVFGMHEFIREFEAYVRESFAGDAETQSNIRNGGVVRLMQLIETHPVLFDTHCAPDFEELLAGPALIELDAITDNRQKALIMAIVLTQAMLAVRKRGHAKNQLRNVLMIDEAHLLLGDGEAAEQGVADPQRAGKTLLQNMTLIARSYGMALLFGDQSPTRLTEEILSNVNLKMMFRLDSRQDRGLLSETALLTDEMRESMISLPPGTGYMHCDMLSRPVHIITPDTEKELKLDKTTGDETVRAHMAAAQPAPYAQCRKCAQCGGVCDMKLRADARFMAGTLLHDKQLQELLNTENHDAALADYLQTLLPQKLQQAQQRFSVAVSDQERFTGCVRLHLSRMLLLSGKCRLTEEELLSDAVLTQKEAVSDEKEVDAFLRSLLGKPPQ